MILKELNLKNVQKQGTIDESAKLLFPLQSCVMLYIVKGSMPLIDFIDRGNLVEG